MAKQNNPEALITQEAEASLNQLYLALSQNQDSFSQKIRVIKLKRAEGSEKKDKDGNTLVDDFGEPMRWEDKYYLSYVALNSGGEHTTQITQAQYLELKENTDYIASGRVEYRQPKEGFNTIPLIVFNSFENASDVFVRAALKLGLGFAK